MAILQSIEALEKANIRETRNRPIIVNASDLNSYYCKYHGHVGTAHKLFKEYLVASFVNCWEFNQSPFCLLEVLPEHIPDNLTILRRSFDVPCFAQQVVKDATELSQFNEDILAGSRKKAFLKEELLALAFFDIWTGNEDRNIGNYNLLYKQEEGSYVLYPIDHEGCFNEQNFERGLVPICYESSLIYSSFFTKVFNVAELKNQERLENLKQRFYLYSRSCKENVNDFLQELPDGWNINRVSKQAELDKYLLNDEWFNTCWHTYLEFLQYFTNE